MFTQFSWISEVASSYLLPLLALLCSLTMNTEVMNQLQYESSFAECLLETLSWMCIFLAKVHK